MGLFFYFNKSFLKNQSNRGSALMGILLASALIGGLVVISVNVVLEMRSSQEIVHQRQDLMTVHMNTIDLLMDSVACNINFQGQPLPIFPVNLTAMRIRSSIADDFMVVDPDINNPTLFYGPKKKLTLETIQMRNYREFNATSRYGTADLLIVFRGRGKGLLNKTVYRSVMLAIEDDGAGNIGNCTAIGTDINQNWSRKLGTNDPYHIYFADDTNTDGVGDVVATSNVGIGCSSKAAPVLNCDMDGSPIVEPNAPTDKLHVMVDPKAAAHYDVEVLGQAAGTTVPAANSYASGTDISGAFHEYLHITPSDRSLKTNIKTLHIGDSFDGIRGVFFHYKNDKVKRIGVLAQEIEKVFPEVVFTDSQTGLKKVAYNKLIAPLIQSNNELILRIKDFKKKQIELDERIMKVLAKKSEVK